MCAPTVEAHQCASGCIWESGCSDPCDGGSRRRSQLAPSMGLDRADISYPIRIRRSELIAPFSFTASTTGADFFHRCRSTTALRFAWLPLVCFTSNCPF